MEEYGILLRDLGIMVIWPVVGGLIALHKKDYFARGFCITLITLVGPFFMIFDKPSLARQGNKTDMHGWPFGGPLAGMVTFVVAMVYALFFMER